MDAGVNFGEQSSRLKIGGWFRQNLILLLVLLSTSSWRCCLAVVVKEGVIYANNYTVFSVRNPGKVVLTLTSLTGDADLYAAESPSEFASAESYDLSSYSCGSDVIAIPYDFKRPVSVAIHGHPFAEETTYRLEAHVLEVKEVDGFLETENREEEESLGPDHNSDRDSKGGTVEIFVTVLFKCLEILADILL